MSPAALSLACLAWRLKKATHVVIWSWIQYSGGKSQGFCVLTVIGLLKVSALLLFQERGATPRSARWPTQALLCLPWGAQHTVSVTKMRALEMLKRQWVCMAPALGSAWGLEHHNPVACVFHTHMFSGNSLQQNWCTKAFYQNDNVDEIEPVPQWKPPTRTSLASPVELYKKAHSFCGTAPPISAQTFSVGPDRIPSCQRIPAKVILVLV